MKKLIFVMLVVCMAVFVNAANINTKISINTDGSAKVSHIIDNIDNSENAVIIPAINPEYVQAVDNSGIMDVELRSDSIAVKPREKDSGYSFELVYLTNSLTSKLDGQWVAKFPGIESKSSGMIFSLPKNMVIYEYTPEGFTFSDKDSMNVGWRLQNKTGVMVRYSNALTDSEPNNVVWYVVSGILGIVLIFSVGYYLLRKKSKTDNDDQKIDTIISTLNPKEKEIYEFIRNNKKVYQSKIQKELGLPKATLSRTIKSLSNRNLVEIRNAGSTNMIIFNEKILKNDDGGLK